jgi:hypothetical protein
MLLVRRVYGRKELIYLCGGVAVDALLFGFTTVYDGGKFLVYALDMAGVELYFLGIDCRSLSLNS